MTIRTEILSVETTGDGLRVTAQGKQKGAPDWVAVEKCAFVVPLRYQRVYYVGRIIDLHIKPR